MHFKMYSKTNCPYCDKVKRVVNSLPDHTLEILMLDENFTRNDFYQKFGHGSTFPQVYADDNLIGGSKETVEFILNSGLLAPINN